jgi:hypothetical protein
MRPHRASRTPKATGDARQFKRIAGSGADATTVSLALVQQHLQPAAGSRQQAVHPENVVPIEAIELVDEGR